MTDPDLLASSADRLWAGLSRRLTGPLSIARFNDEVRERRFARFAGAFGPQDIAAVYDLGRLSSAVARAVIPPHFIDIHSGGQLVKLADMQSKSGKSSMTLLIEQLRSGATIRVRELQTFDAGIAALVSEVQRVFEARSQLNLYLTPPATSGFAPHFDTTDVFIVQCTGGKQWTVFEQYADQQTLPLMETPWEPQRYKPQGAGTTMELTAGDVLYLPRGAMHTAACLNQTSLHLTISLSPLTVADVLVREVKRFAEANVALRQRALWSLGADTDALTAEIRRQFHELARVADARDAVEAERRVFGADDGGGAGGGALVACLADLEAKQRPKS